MEVLSAALDDIVNRQPEVSIGFLLSHTRILCHTSRGSFEGVTKFGEKQSTMALTFEALNVNVAFANPRLCLVWLNKFDGVPSLP